MMIMEREILLIFLFHFRGEGIEVGGRRGQNPRAHFSAPCDAASREILATRERERAFPTCKQKGVRTVGLHFERASFLLPFLRRAIVRCALLYIIFVHFYDNFKQPFFCSFDTVATKAPPIN